LAIAALALLERELKIQPLKFRLAAVIVLLDSVILQFDPKESFPQKV